MSPLRVMKLIHLSAVFALALLSSCASLDAHFDTMLAPDFPPPQATLAVFGVYSEGRLDPDYWPRIAGPMAAAFDVPACEPLYGKQLRDTDVELYETLSARAQNEGVSNELLQSIEAHTQAPLIGFVYVEPPAKVTRPQRGQSRMPVPAPGGRRGRRGMITPAAPQESEDSALMLTLYIYSRATRDIVAQLSMRYSGARPEDAPRLFVNRVGRTFGDLKCVGWH
jgi:hypothetical protein